MHSILIVEDNADLAYVIAQSLTDAGFSVSVTLDSMTALDCIQSDQSFDLLLLDLGMPQGMPHGLSLALIARTRNPGIHVIFTTGNADWIEEDLPLPGRMFLKPFSLDELVEEVRAQLGE